MHALSPVHQTPKIYCFTKEKCHFYSKNFSTIFSFWRLLGQSTKYGEWMRAVMFLSHEAVG